MDAGVEDQRVVVGIEHLLHMNIDDKAQETGFRDIDNFPISHLFHFLLPLENI